MCVCVSSQFKIINDHFCYIYNTKIPTKWLNVCLTFANLYFPHWTRTLWRFARLLFTAQRITTTKPKIFAEINNGKKKKKNTTNDVRKKVIGMASLPKPQEPVQKFICF